MFLPVGGFYFLSFLFVFFQLYTFVKAQRKVGGGTEFTLVIYPDAALKIVGRNQYRQPEDRTSNNFLTYVDLSTALGKIRQFRCSTSMFISLKQMVVFWQQGRKWAIDR